MKSPAELRIEKKLMEDRALVVDRLRGFSAAEVARLHGCTTASVSHILRRCGRSVQVRGRWRYQITTRRAALLDLTPELLIHIGAVEFEPGMWRSCEPLTHREWWLKYVKPQLVAA